MHNDITSVIIHRVKNIAGYPESSSDVLLNPSLLTELDLYGDGPVRAMEVRTQGGWLQRKDDSSDHFYGYFLYFFFFSFFYKKREKEVI